MTLNTGQKMPGCSDLTVEQALVVALTTPALAGSHDLDILTEILDNEDIRLRGVRQAWEKEPWTLHGVTLVPGEFYNFTIKNGNWSLRQAAPRAHIACRYLGRRSFHPFGDVDKPLSESIRFEQFGAKGLKGETGWIKEESATVGTVTGIVTVEPTPGLLQVVAQRDETRAKYGHVWSEE